VVRAASPVRLDDETAVRGRRVLVVEDGPTLTHGGMTTGAGYAAARAAGAAAIVDPRPFAAGPVRDVFARYPHIGPVLPAMGYDAEGIVALGATIAAAPADVVVAGTPIDLARVVASAKPVVRARYAYADFGEPTLAACLAPFLDRLAAERRP
jgi:predicted GTPase